jgi:hypothetical protein
MSKPTKNDSLQALRAAALKLPGVEVGIACAGTALEKRTLKVRGKAFLFLGPKDAMLKLQDSLPQAVTLAAREPGRFKVGAHGWTTVVFGDDNSVPLDLLLPWAEESYLLFASKLSAASPTKSEPASEKRPKKAPTRKPKRRNA